MPKVSIIMGIFNCEQYVGKAIASIKCQTFRDWECIICDDGSKDNTWNAVCRHVSDDKRFVLLRNEKNLGLGATLNKCIEKAQGEYLARQDGDDTSHSQRLERLVKFLDENPDIAVVGSYAELCDKFDRVWGVLKPPLNPSAFDWLKGSCVIHASTLMRKDVLLKCGLYDPTALRVEDYDLWLRMLKKGFRIVTFPEVLYRYKLDLEDYRKKKFRYRLKEAATILRHAREVQAPLRYYVYALKPIICGLMPSVVMYIYHRRKFQGF
ncbi:MAG: glycosyltransferase family 2 protein [Deltaproteobacteria bacterium]|nr:glycosyltransferase family 2 protein [Deltaproteobacteria bacterium]